MNLHLVFAYLGRLGCRNAIDYETAMATWYDDELGPPPTLAECEAAWPTAQAGKRRNHVRADAESLATAAANHDALYETAYLGQLRALLDPDLDIDTAEAALVAIREELAQ